MNLSIIWHNFSPFKTSTGPSPSSFNMCLERKVLLATNTMAHTVARPQCVRHLLLNQGFNLIENFSRATFCHQMIIFTQMNSCSSHILLLVHDVIHASYTRINIEKGAITHFSKRWTRSKMSSLKVMNNVTNPSYFISTLVKKKEITTIISTLQMAQITHFLKSKVEIVLNVSHFNIAPRMAIMFHAHSCIYPK